MLSKELVAASTVPLVLSILSGGESYGYELIQQVPRLSGGKIEWTEGMLYPAGVALLFLVLAFVFVGIWPMFQGGISVEPQSPPPGLPPAR